MSTTTPVNDADAGRLAAARDKVSDAAAHARDATAHTLTATRDTVGAAFDDARGKVTDGYRAASEKVGDTLEEARDTLSDAGERTVAAIRDNPVVALLGGLFAGALAAALLPRTEREVAAFGTLGKRLNDAAREAAGAARTAGQEKLDEIGLNKGQARDTVVRLFGDIAKAAASAGTAAVGSVKGERL